jgi:hypothetical protein
MFNIVPVAEVNDDVGQLDTAAMLGSFCKHGPSFRTTSRKRDDKDYAA